MRYFQTKLGFIIDSNENIVPMDESQESYKEYVKFLKNKGTVETTDVVLDYEIAMEKQEALERLRMECYTQLLVTDWYLIRMLDTGDLVPEEITAERNEIRKKYADLITKLLEE